MGGDQLYVSLELAVVTLEVLTVYVFQRGLLRTLGRKPIIMVGAYLLFFLIFAMASLYAHFTMLLPIVTLLGIFSLSIFLYRGNLMTHLLMTALLVAIGITIEAMVYGLHTSLIQAELEGLERIGADRLLGRITSKMGCLAAVHMIFLFQSRHIESASRLFWQSLLLTASLAVLIFLVTNAFMHSYQEHGMLMNRAMAEILGLILLSIVIFWFYHLVLSAYQARHEKEMYLMNLKSQENYYKSYEESMEAVAAMDHDFKNHMITVNGMLREGDIHSAMAYLTNLSGVANEFKIVITPNHVVNAILTHMVRCLRQMDLEPKLDIAIPEELSIDPIDLTVILGNTVDNALEALEHVPAAERYLELQMKQHGQLLYFEIRNPYGPPSKGKDKGLLGRGYGLKNVEICVQKYRGELNIVKKEGGYVLAVLLPCG